MNHRLLFAILSTAFFEQVVITIVRVATTYRAVELDLRLDAIAFSAQIHRRRPLNVARHHALNVNLPAKKAAPMPARCQLVIERREVARDFAIKLFRKCMGIEAQHR